MHSQEAGYRETRWAAAGGTTVYDFPLAVEFAAQLPSARRVLLPAVLNLTETWYFAGEALRKLEGIRRAVIARAGQLWLALAAGSQPYRQLLARGLLGDPVLVDPDGVGLWRLAGSI